MQSKNAIVIVHKMAGVRGIHKLIICTIFETQTLDTR